MANSKKSTKSTTMLKANKSKTLKPKKNKSNLARTDENEKKIGDQIKAIVRKRKRSLGSEASFMILKRKINVRNVPRRRCVKKNAKNGHSENDRRNKNMKRNFETNAKFSKRLKKHISNDDATSKEPFSEETNCIEDNQSSLKMEQHISLSNETLNAQTNSKNTRQAFNTESQTKSREEGATKSREEGATKSGTILKKSPKQACLKPDSEVFVTPEEEKPMCKTTNFTERTSLKVYTETFKSGETMSKPNGKKQKSPKINSEATSTKTKEEITSKPNGKKQKQTSPNMETTTFTASTRKEPTSRANTKKQTTPKIDSETNSLSAKEGLTSRINSKKQRHVTPPKASEINSVSSKEKQTPRSNSKKQKQVTPPKADSEINTLSSKEELTTRANSKKQKQVTLPKADSEINTVSPKEELTPRTNSKNPKQVTPPKTDSEINTVSSKEELTTRANSKKQKQVTLPKADSEINTVSPKEELTPRTNSKNPKQVTPPKKDSEINTVSSKEELTPRSNSKKQKQTTPKTEMETSGSKDESKLTTPLANRKQKNPTPKKNSSTTKKSKTPLKMSFDFIPYIDKIIEEFTSFNSQQHPKPETLLDKDFSENSSSDEEYEPNEDELNELDDTFHEEKSQTSERDLQDQYQTIEDDSNQPNDTFVYQTRSKVSYMDTALEDMEKAFIPPDIDQDMYDYVIHDEDWKNFLNEFTKPIDKISINNEEDDDTEFIPNINEDDIIDSEELRRDPGVKVSKKELNELMGELFEINDIYDYEDIDQVDNEENINEYVNLKFNETLNEASVNVSVNTEHMESPSKSMLKNNEFKTNENIDMTSKSMFRCKENKNIEKKVKFKTNINKGVPNSSEINENFDTNDRKQVGKPPLKQIGINSKNIENNSISRTIQTEMNNKSENYTNNNIGKDVDVLKEKDQSECNIDKEVITKDLNQNKDIDQEDSSEDIKDVKEIRSSSTKRVMIKMSEIKYIYNAYIKAIDMYKMRYNIKDVEMCYHDNIIDYGKQIFENICEHMSNPSMFNSKRNIYSNQMPNIYEYKNNISNTSLAVNNPLNSTKLLVENTVVQNLKSIDLNESSNQSECNSSSNCSRSMENGSGLFNISNLDANNQSQNQTNQSSNQSGNNYLSNRSNSMKKDCIFNKQSNINAERHQNTNQILNNTFFNSSNTFNRIENDQFPAHETMIETTELCTKLFEPEDLQLLTQQINQHIQYCLQHYLQTYNHPKFHAMSKQFKTMIEVFYKLSKRDLNEHGQLEPTENRVLIEPPVFVNDRSTSTSNELNEMDISAVDTPKTNEARSNVIFNKLNERHICENFNPDLSIKETELKIKQHISSTDKLNKTDTRRSEKTVTTQTTAGELNNEQSIGDGNTTQTSSNITYTETPIWKKTNIDQNKCNDSKTYHSTNGIIFDKINKPNSSVSENTPKNTTHFNTKPRKTYFKSLNIDEAIQLIRTWETLHSNALFKAHMTKEWNKCINQWKYYKNTLDLPIPLINTILHNKSFIYPLLLPKKSFNSKQRSTEVPKLELNNELNLIVYGLINYSYLLKSNRNTTNTNNIMIDIISLIRKHFCPIHKLEYISTKIFDLIKSKSSNNIQMFFEHGIVEDVKHFVIAYNEEDVVVPKDQHLQLIPKNWREYVKKK